MERATSPQSGYEDPDPRGMTKDRHLDPGWNIPTAEFEGPAVESRRTSFRKYQQNGVLIGRGEGVSPGASAALDAGRMGRLRPPMKRAPKSEWDWRLPPVSV